MTQEEKAKRYDEAVREASIAYKDEDRHLKATLERIFPELKESESEEENIRNWLIGYFHQYKEDGMEEYANGLKVDSIIAWIEKHDKMNINSSFIAGAEYPKIKEEWMNKAIKFLDSVNPYYYYNDYSEWKTEELIENFKKFMKGE